MRKLSVSDVFNCGVSKESFKLGEDEFRDNSGDRSEKENGIERDDDREGEEVQEG